MNIVHTVASLRADHGGPSRSVPALCRALAEAGDSVHLVTTHDPRLGPVTRVDGAVNQVAVPVGGSMFAGSGRKEFRRAVVDAARGAETVLHDHGLWLPTNHAVARIARRNDLPRVVSVRGMLTSWARQQRKYRKALAWRTYQRADLATASVIHVTSDDELAAVLDLGLGAPLVLIPNGVEVPAQPAEMHNDRPRSALFLSRLHPGKGALELIGAWSRVRPSGWRLTIAGPDSDGHRAVLEEAVTAAGLEDVVRFAGPVGDAEKWDVYGAADLFVLPTRSENFGLSIAEALAAGVPVITTRGAPWRELETERCGWWVAHGPEALSAALRDAVRMEPEERRQMGARGRRLVEERYAWSSIAARKAAVYRWLLHGGPPPGDVVEPDRR